MRKNIDIVLTDHMLTALQLIEEYRYLTVNQVAQIVPLKPKTVSEMLKRLEGQKALGAFGNVGIRGWGKTPKVYYLTRHGHAVLREGLGADDDELRPFRPINVRSKWSPIMWHRIATIDVVMAAEKAVRSMDDYELSATFVEYRRRKVGGRAVAETMDYVALPHTSENKIVPDAGFVISSVATGKRALFLIEVDMGTETEKSSTPENIDRSFNGKMEKYDRYQTGKTFREKYSAFGDFRYFVTLVITDSERRMQNMRKKGSSLSHNFHQYYRFSTLDEVCGSFFHANWWGRDVADQTPHTLIRRREP